MKEEIKRKKAAILVLWTGGRRKGCCSFLSAEVSCPKRVSKVLPEPMCSNAIQIDTRLRMLLSEIIASVFRVERNGAGKVCVCALLLVEGRVLVVDNGAQK